MKTKNKKSIIKACRHYGMSFAVQPKGEFRLDATASI